MLYKAFFVGIVYLFLNCEMFFDFILKKIDGAMSMDNTITNKGEIIRFIMFMFMFLFIESFVGDDV
jgi:hypothetical protein